MKYDISFIHTAEVHVNTFGLLIDELSPNLSIKHVVDESLLSHAQKFSADHQLELMLKDHINELSQESRMIIVTCSSIGGIAENLGVIAGCQIQRIDRAMADYAVKNGAKILVVAALESTLKPTSELLNNSITNINVSPQISFHHIESAWEHFLSGNMEQYYNEIIAVLTSNESEYDMVVLAQASMAGVESKINLSIPIISSPKIGVENAISILQQVILNRS